MPTLEDLKFFFASLFFFTVVWPLKRFVFPVLEWFVNNVYMLLAFFLMYCVYYIYDGNINRFIEEITTKVSTQDMWFLNLLFISPEILGYPIVIWIAVFAIICAIYHLFTSLLPVVRNVKRAFGDVSLAVLFCFYHIKGEKHNSLMCMDKVEVKSKIVLYLLVALLFAVVVALVLYTTGPEIGMYSSFIGHATSAAIPNASTEELQNFSQSMMNLSQNYPLVIP